MRESLKDVSLSDGEDDGEMEEDKPKKSPAKEPVNKLSTEPGNTGL